MFQHPLKAEVSQKRCSFYIQDDGELQIGIVLQLCELISEEKRCFADFSLKDISTWGTQSQTAAFVFSETPLVHIKDCFIIVVFQKSRLWCEIVFQIIKCKANRVKLWCPIDIYGKTPNKHLVVLSIPDKTWSLPWSCKIY